VLFNRETPAPSKMDTLSELSQSALEALATNYVVIIAIAILVLGLTLYLYFFPTSEYFKSGGGAHQTKETNDKKLPNTGRVE
jgi:hypothetical protein